MTGTSRTHGPNVPKQERPSAGAAAGRKKFGTAAPMAEDAVKPGKRKPQPRTPQMAEDAAKAAKEIESLRSDITEMKKTIGKLGIALAAAQRQIAMMDSALYGSEDHESVMEANPEGVAARVREIFSVVYGDENTEDILRMFPEGIAAGITMELMETQDLLGMLSGVLGGYADKPFRLDNRVGKLGNELTELQLILMNAFGHDFERARAMGNDNFEWSKALLLTQLCSEYVNVESIRELAVRRGPVTIKHALEDFTKPEQVKIALESKFLQEGEWLNTGLKQKIERNSQAIIERARFFLAQIDFEALVMEMHADDGQK